MNHNTPLKSLIRICMFGVCLASPAWLSAASPLVSKRLADGDKVIDFDLPVVGGDEYISLSDEYKSGPVVLVVLRGYPGYQCEICSQQLSSFRNRAKVLAKEASRVILVYPGEGTSLKRHAERFVGSRSVPDPLVVVRDQDMKMVEEWGLRWKGRRESAYPATYIIDRNGRVHWQKVSKDHSGRANMEEILKVLRKL